MPNSMDNTLSVELPSEPNLRDELKSLLETVRRHGDCDVVMDFSHVDIVTSASFSSLIQLREWMNGTGCRLVLCGLSSATRNLFDVAGLMHAFEMCEGMSEAMVTLDANESC